MTILDSSILSLYTSLASSTNNGNASLLSTVYGGGTTSSHGTSSQSPVQALLSAQRNQTTGVKLTENQPDVKTAISSFTKAVGSAKSLTAALHNPAVLNILLTANGMADQIGNTALAVKVLTSNLSDPNSLANVLTDPRWKTLAQTYNFPANGLKVLQNPSTVSAITQGYAKITWEHNLNATTPGISDALTFIDSAKSITSIDGVLGNTTVRNVVTTALGVPAQIAFQSLNAQEQAISTRFDVRKLQNQSYVQSFAERFLVMNNLNASSSSSSTPTDINTLAAQLQGSSRA